MATCRAEITLDAKKRRVIVDRLGRGPFPMIISGHAEIYLEIFKRAFKAYEKETGEDLSSKFSFFFPRLYWCKGAPLSELPEDVQKKVTMQDMVRHIEEVRISLEQQGLLEKTGGKVAVYGHSGFSAIAMHHACSYPKSHLAQDLEGPVPFFNEQYGKEMGLFLKGNASEKRLSALRDKGYGPFDIALDEDCMRSFGAFSSTYSKMEPAFFYTFDRSRGRDVWGRKELNMVMMKHYFLELMPGYDCRTLLPKIETPISVSVGMYDPSPGYLWNDIDGGVGFFKRKEAGRSLRPKKRQKQNQSPHGTGNRNTTTFERSSHWPSAEQPEDRFKALIAFIDKNLPDVFSKTPTSISSGIFY